MMKILIPTAKEMTTPKSNTTLPLSEKSQLILNYFSSLSSDDLASYYGITKTAAQKEWERWQALKSNQARLAPAIDLFNGLMYRQLERPFTPKEEAFITQHLFITSAFYGIIPALSPIAPHRLDFMGKLKLKGQSLKQYWRTAYDQSVSDTELILSLLSSEFEQVFSPAIRKRFVGLRFLEEKDGQLKSHSTISKKARGQFLNQVIKKELTDIEQIKNLTFNDFRYNAEHSTNQQLTFIRSS